MVEFTNSLIDDIDNLLNLRVGDLIRLEYIKKMLLDNKPLYTSDRQYLDNLIGKYLRAKNSDIYVDPKSFEVKCWNCETPLSQSSNYCPSCGVKQNKEFANTNPFISQRKTQNFHPLDFVHLRLYQILAVVGGLAAFVPILIAVSDINVILESLGFSFNEDSLVPKILVACGVIASLLCILVISVSFVVKNPRKVGRILFFAAFGILVTSVLVGIVGFVLIIVASILAFKKRGY